MKSKQISLKNRRRNKPKKNGQQVNLLKNSTQKQSTEYKPKIKAKVSKAMISDDASLSSKYIFVLLLVTAIALIAIYYNSILIYCQQTYHSDIFNTGSLTQVTEQKDSQESIEITSSTPKDATKGQTDVNHTINNESLLNQSAKNSVINSSDETDKNPKIIRHNKIYEQLNVIKQKRSELNRKAAGIPPLPEQKISVVKSESPKIDHQDIPLIHEPLPIVVTKNDKVFFVGDSLMQGVAPYVKKMLFKQYKVESLDLSKQSTGLAYPNAFNWPKTIDDNLIADPAIKLLVVFWGPNDPWDFPVKGYAKYAKFKSELWEEQYRLRIAMVLNSAYEHDVQVLWLAVPCMRKRQLNEGMIYLNTLYQSELEKTQQHFLSTNQLLGCTYEKYSNFIESGKDKIKVRVDDGVHFTTAGQKILAKAIMEKIIFKQLEGGDSD
ncbi:SGNH/GDSL hydrolase family protein [Gilliamella apicola]|uniref:DUF459 domain-containing protein n=1 Tax=Gilliamella apicola TaxID=1196095 RepID=A0A2V4E2U3_9GAMM|nr:DUF459 domain-containing protein [Gilliamella apicola]PXZ05481.1 hypothetical protein DKK79_01975 [Gilliamella apicola]